MGKSIIRSIMQWTDKWKFQCLMINNLALWLDSHRLFQKSLQIAIVTIDFISLFVSIMSLQQRQQIHMYFPVYGHFLLNSVYQIQSYQNLQHMCHYFDDLSYVRYVGFNLEYFYKIRIAILLFLFIVDMLGLFFSFVHPTCGGKMYIIGLVVTLLFFVLFPSEFCINFGNKCIERSPIFKIYRIEFMIQFNVAWLGIGSILIMVVIYPVVLIVQRWFNWCGANDLFFQVIYGIVCLPFFTIALVNFVTSLWTSSALINILTLSSTIINYVLYHAGTDVGEQIARQKWEIKKILQADQNIKNKGINGYINDANMEQQQFQQWLGQQIQIYQSLKAPYFTHQHRNQQAMYLSPLKPDRMRFYRQWQDRMQRQFRAG